MNCTACSAPIDKNKGYYLVMGSPYCIECYHKTHDTSDTMQWIHPSPHQREPKNLLEAFRAYQKLNQATRNRPS
jgi:hypothetical protein